ANDYADSLRLGADWWSLDAPWQVRAVDVGQVRSGPQRQRYFINGLGLGFNGAVTLESRRIRRFQGVPLYALAFLRALWYHYRCPLLRVWIDGRLHQVPTLALTVAVGRREGNFVVAPAAELDDGLFDFLLAGDLARWELVRHLPGL